MRKRVVRLPIPTSLQTVYTLGAEDEFLVQAVVVNSTGATEQATLQVNSNGTQTPVLSTARIPRNDSRVFPLGFFPLVRVGVIGSRNRVPETLEAQATAVGLFLHLVLTPDDPRTLVSPPLQ